MGDSSAKGCHLFICYLFALQRNIFLLRSKGEIGKGNELLQKDFNY